MSDPLGVTSCVKCGAAFGDSRRPSRSGLPGVPSVRREVGAVSSNDGVPPRLRRLSDSGMIDVYVGVGVVNVRVGDAEDFSVCDLTPKDARALGNALVEAARQAELARRKTS